MGPFLQLQTTRHYGLNLRCCMLCIVFTYKRKPFSLETMDEEEKICKISKTTLIQELRRNESQSKRKMKKKKHLCFCILQLWYVCVCFLVHFFPLTRLHPPSLLSFPPPSLLLSFSSTFPILLFPPPPPFNP